MELIRNHKCAGNLPKENRQEAHPDSAPKKKGGGVGLESRGVMFSLADYNNGFGRGSIRGGRRLGIYGTTTRLIDDSGGEISVTLHLKSLATTVYSFVAFSTQVVLYMSSILSRVDLLEKSSVCVADSPDSVTPQTVLVGWYHWEVFLHALTRGTLNIGSLERTSTGMINCIS